MWSPPQCSPQVCCLANEADISNKVSLSAHGEKLTEDSSQDLARVFQAQGLAPGHLGMLISFSFAYLNNSATCGSPSLTWQADSGGLAETSGSNRLCRWLCWATGRRSPAFALACLGHEWLDLISKNWNLLFPGVGLVCTPLCLAEAQICLCPPLLVFLEWFFLLAQGVIKEEGPLCTRTPNVNLVLIQFINKCLAWNLRQGG